ncbi:hypothetical protein DV515_00014938 [Chloebia gouldiae]|uniref:Uncharacterized protein n=1 Tax=Chloebia gouldiae TaxID=44316 RepID=A0A3L8RWS1_CHLGU|nr:hypothetical protein DV515_00014938 [Chloebia gouldiae]
MPSAWETPASGRANSMLRSGIRISICRGGLSCEEASWNTDRWPLLWTRKDTRPPDSNSAWRDTQKCARSLGSRVDICLPPCETLRQNKRPGSSNATPAGQCNPCARSVAEPGKSIHPDLLLPLCGKKATAVSIPAHKDKAMPSRVDKFVSIA